MITGTKRKLKATFGSTDVARMNPDISEHYGCVQVVLNLDQALKLQVAVAEAVRRLHRIETDDPGRKNERGFAMNLFHNGRILMSKTSIEPRAKGGAK